MKKLRILTPILVILFIGLFAAHFSYASVVSRAPEEVKEAFKSVVEVRVTVIWRGSLKVEGGGSGFFVARGYVLTVPHIASEFHQVVEDPQTKFEVKVGGRIFRAQLVAADWRKELMLLKVEGAPRLPIVKFASTIEEGETVFITGYMATPIGNKRKRYISAPALVNTIDEIGTTTKGSIAWLAMERYGVTKLLTIYGITGQRVSGGPIFNMKGEVVGASWLISGLAPNHVFATPVDVIREFLEEHLDNFKKDG